MRKISELEIVAFHKASSPNDYTRMCSRLVGAGYTPYGKVYTHGDYLMRDFVQYEYFPADDEEYMEFEENENDGEVIQEHPWEEQDFFTEVGDIDE